ncbi:MAG: hypothetical protein KA072_14995 [Thermoanaerobaculaceae bacterium]|nr:hypothetical protein [Thermoanaerobaculaceae bacterium]MDI9620927.1 hypothetical protein [Acidobacteriota bacterium]NLH12440.1 hypothetical protein [Holophagae bacterium]
MGFFFSHTCTCCGFRMASSGPDEVYQTTDGALHSHPEAFDFADLPGCTRRSEIDPSNV